MKKLFVFLLIAALVLAGIAATGGSASAKAGTPKNHWSCTDSGTVNYFGTHGTETTVTLFGVEQPTYAMTTCQFKGLELHKFETNTRAEYITLRDYYQEQVDGRNDISGLNVGVLWCRKNPVDYKAYLYDLSYFSDGPDYSRAQKKTYDSWVKRYATKHSNCRVLR